MSYYVSNPNVNLKDKFILSFDAKLTSGKELIVFGANATASNPTSLDQAITKLNRGVVIDNGTAVFAKSSLYTTDGTYIWRRDNSANELLGLKLEIVNGKVYEEVKDISTYNADTEMMYIFVKNNTLFKHTPGKYTIVNNVPKLVFANVKLTSIYSFEGGKIKLEQYHIADHLQGFSGKLRFIFNNSCTTLDIAKRVNDVYETIQSFFYGSSLPTGYIHLGGDKVAFENLNVTYSY